MTKNWKTTVLLIITGLFLSIAFPGAVSGAGNIVINATNFPDTAFRTEIKDYYDDNRDGYLSPSEIASITYLDVGTLEERISSLKGIEHFTALETLYCCSNNVAALDLSKNTRLKEIYVMDNHISSITLGGSSLERIDVSNNSLGALDLSGFPYLKEINCSGNKLTSLTLGTHSALTSLNCSDNNLSSLTLSGCKALTSLTCSKNKLTKLDVSGLTAIYGLDCSDNMLSVLSGTEAWMDFSYCVALNISGNPVKSFDISWMKTEWQDFAALLKQNALSVKENALQIDASSFDTATELIWEGKVFFPGREDRSVQSVTSCGQTAYVVLWDDGLLSVCGVGAVADCPAYSVDNKTAASWRNNSSVKALEICSNITSVGKNAFQETRASALTMSGDLDIMEGAFMGADYSSIDFGSGDVRITGMNAFQSCKKLESVTIPSNVSLTGRQAFQFCTKLRSAAVECNGVLPDYTFEGCTALSSLDIRGNITSIGSQCFRVLRWIP